MFSKIKTALEKKYYEKLNKLIHAELTATGFKMYLIVSPEYILKNLQQNKE
jgi:hypothetical protein